MYDHLKGSIFAATKLIELFSFKFLRIWKYDYNLFPPQNNLVTIHIIYVYFTSLSFGFEFQCLHPTLTLTWGLGVHVLYKVTLDLNDPKLVCE